MDGVVSYFNTRAPTKDELGNKELQFFWATAEDTWEPYAHSFAEREQAAHSRRDDQRLICEVRIAADDNNLLDRMLMSRNLTTQHKGMLSNHLMQHSKDENAIPNIDDQSAEGIQSSHQSIRAEELAKRWYIGVETAKRTLQATTQKALLRNVTHLVDQRLKRQAYHRKRIAQGKWFSDTTFYKLCTIRTKALAHDGLQNPGITSHGCKQGGTRINSGHQHPVEQTSEEIWDRPIMVDQTILTMAKPGRKRNWPGKERNEEDKHLQAEVRIPMGNKCLRGVVKKRVKDDDGLPIWKRHPNPLLDTRMYEVEMPEGTVEAYRANLIAANIYSQFEEIIDHRNNNHAVTKEEGRLTMRSGTTGQKKTTIGWEQLLSFKERYLQWVQIADAKESFPIEVKEYAANNKITPEEPAFSWWVKDGVLQSMDRVICKIRSKYWRRFYKFGIKLPHLVKEALEINQMNGNSLWKDVIAKEMNVGLLLE
eukprot:jgi/Psemu1/26146/gm1.26146_g